MPFYNSAMTSTNYTYCLPDVFY